MCVLLNTASHQIIINTPLASVAWTASSDSSHMTLPTNLCGQRKTFIDIDRLVGEAKRDIGKVKRDWVWNYPYILGFFSGKLSGGAHMNVNRSSKKTLLCPFHNWLVANFCLAHIFNFSRGCCETGRGCGLKTPARERACSCGNVPRNWRQGPGLCSVSTVDPITVSIAEEFVSVGSVRITRSVALLLPKFTSLSFLPKHPIFTWPGQSWCCWHFVGDTLLFSVQINK